MEGDGAIPNFMLKIFSDYSHIRGKSRNAFSMPFWDVVVITASDEEQKKAFVMQVRSKLHRRELPNVEYIIIADPTDTKIGSGGSTFHVFSELRLAYGDEFSSLRVLLIHAGGYSQRLPSHSLCGKLFSCLPIARADGLLWQVLDFKLALFLPLLERMPPGVFITASDDIVTFTLEGTDLNFECPGFTALGHPSSLDVGSTHGVYVLPDDVSEGSCCRTESCLRVLQKPSVDEMRKAGAVRKQLQSNLEFVYSDSAFFMHFSVVDKLLKSFPDLNPLSCETDVYGDFLQPLGTGADNSYIDTKDVTSELSRIRQGLFNLLFKTPLNVLVLPKSKFYHVGTLKEFSANWSQDKFLARELNIQRLSFSSVIPDGSGPHIEGVLMHSIVHSESLIGSECILEQCRFEVPVVSKSAVVNGCQLRSGCGPVPVSIPDRVLFFTCSVLVDNTVKWVCGAIHFDDDVKQSCDINECGQIKFLNRKLENICGIYQNQDASDFFDPGQSVCSLWRAKLFPVCDSMDDSFLGTLGMVETVLNGLKSSGTFQDVERMSMADLIDKKSVEGMLDFREKLCDDISLIRKS